MSIHPDYEIFRTVMFPWAGLADDLDECDRYQGMDWRDPATFPELIDRDLVPPFQSLSRSVQQEAIAALVRISREAPEIIGRFWSSMLPPFPLPRDYPTSIRTVAERLQQAYESGEQQIA